MTIDPAETETASPSNHQLAGMLAEIADLLERQGASAFRVKAYRNAADWIGASERALVEILAARGPEGLEALPTIGPSIARLIQRRIATGHCTLLDRLRGESRGERIFTSVPEIGPKLAQQIHDTLGIETLPELLAAAHDGRLARVPGIGKKRTRAVRECLTGRFQKAADRTPTYAPSVTETITAVTELLEVDAEYLRRADAGKLVKISPRQFNPTGEAWLPILHTERDGRHYTALFSNTARAHQLGTTNDWVVIYRDDAPHPARWTVITSQYGPLEGRRIVRGREADCAEHYQLADRDAPSAGEFESRAMR